ncbi:phytanoyl-CoA dioxygenase family protein [Alcaligenaceae bacterium LF4-65]|jgi:hypothetical protein|uniref:Phytanoyl-CoA dioxygenase family protein n=1 Tax=Zwartia hollandica TaxID=324606 RepID=A0A953NC97_9BURK|nr:phytanoyl-CoA dioxygenase family protein [Zwartia hollandica]MBZ1350611.1 phytanoyl-CoA dioxygenase family protein [Zwartia hollandica]
MKSLTVILEWLVAPFLFFTGYKSFRDNAALGNVRLNRLGLHVFRAWLADRMARLRRLLLGRYVPDSVRKEYEKNGFVMRESFLSAANFEGVRREVFESDWPIREMQQGSARTRKVFLDMATLAHSHPNLFQLLSSKDLIAQIRYVAGIGGEPLFTIQHLICEAGQQTDPQMMLHQDTFHSTAKAWLYLENVPEDGCPFSYVPGSHIRSRRRLRWEYEQSQRARLHPVLYHARGSFRASLEDIRCIGLPDPVRFVVPANTLIIGDTSGFHARTPTAEKTVHRIEIYASLRRNPFLPWTGLDFFSLPFIRKNHGAWAIGLMTLLARPGWVKMPWKKTGHGKLRS